MSVLNHSLSASCLHGCDQEYIVSSNRYNIYEDFGPLFAIEVTPPTFILFYAWPVAIGTVSLFYCGDYSGVLSLFLCPGSLVSVMAIRSFYKRHREFKQMKSNSQGASRGLYLRLMALSTTEILGTIPLGTYFIVANVRAGVAPWKGWAYTHSNYSEVIQIAGFIWKNDPYMAHGLEMFRWSLVACAFIFFVYFGFADETRQLYRRMYNSIANRIGCPGLIPQGPSYLCVVHLLR